MPVIEQGLDAFRGVLDVEERVGAAVQDADATIHPGYDYGVGQAVRVKEFCVIALRRRGIKQGGTYEKHVQATRQQDGAPVQQGAKHWLRADGLPQKEK